MDSGFLVTAGGTALVSAIAIQWMKESELEVFNFLGTSQLYCQANLVFSILVAFVTSIGIGYKYDATTGTLILSGLTIANLEHGLWHWFIQWVGQHVAYKTVIVPSKLQAANVSVLKQLSDQLKGWPVPVQVHEVDNQVKDK